MEKPKRKRKLKPHFEIVSPLDAPTCAALLAIENQRIVGRIELKTQVVPMDADTYRYEADWKNGYFNLKADGTLKTWEDTSTRITGRIGVSPGVLFYVFVLVLPAFFCCMLTAFPAGEAAAIEMLDALVFVVGAIAVMLGLFWFVTLTLGRKQFVSHLEGLLTEAPGGIASDDNSM